MIGFNQLALASCLVAMALALSLQSTEAQKTIANSYQQELSGSNPNGVYGGYNQQSSSFNRQRQQSFAAPVQNQRRTQSSYSSSKQTSLVRPQQPVYEQQQQQSSYEASSSSQEQAEADAEPASYGKQRIN